MISTVNAGLSALAMAATPEGTRPVPQANSVNGKALVNIPSHRKDRHRPANAQGRTPSAGSTSHIAALASATRAHATVSGGKCAPSSLKNRNEQPHGRLNANSRLQSRRVMRERCMSRVAAIAALNGPASAAGYQLSA